MIAYLLITLVALGLVFTWVDLSRTQHDEIPAPVIHETQYVMIPAPAPIMLPPEADTESIETDRLLLQLIRDNEE